MSDDLSDFVNARISEDEAVVRGTNAQREARDLWVSEWPEGQLGVSRARMQVEIEAKRRLIALGDVMNDDHILRVLAMVYDDHVDWRPDWRVLDSAAGDQAFTQQFD